MGPGMRAGVGHWSGRKREGLVCTSRRGQARGAWESGCQGLGVRVVVHAGVFFQRSGYKVGAGACAGTGAEVGARAQARAV